MAARFRESDPKPIRHLWISCGYKIIALCKVEFSPELDSLLLVDAALESNCNDCRGIVMVGPMSQKGCELRAPLSYTPQPYPDADEILKKR